MLRSLIGIQFLAWMLSTTLAFAQATPLLSIENENGQVGIRANNISLGEVLLAINELTGISFSVSEEFQSDPVTADLTAPDWKTGVQMLLEPYARMELWNESLELSKIKILSRDPNAPFPAMSSAGSPGSASIGATGNSASQVESNINLPKLDKSKIPQSKGLSKKQLRRLGRGKLKSPLSPAILSDPSLLPFLKQFGITTQQDTQDTFKAMKVRVHARRLAKSR